MGMIKHVMTTMLVSAMMVGLAGPVAAQSLMVSGKIVSIDAEQQRLKLRTGLFATKEFEVAPDAKITAGQRPMELEQLQRGHEATVEYSEEDGKRVAQSIRVQAEAAEEAPASPLGSEEPSRQQAPKEEPAPLKGAEPPSSAPALPGAESPSTAPPMEQRDFPSESPFAPESEPREGGSPQGAY